MRASTCAAPASPTRGGAGIARSAYAPASFTVTVKRPSASVVASVSAFGSPTTGAFKTSRRFFVVAAPVAWTQEPGSSMS